MFIKNGIGLKSLKKVNLYILSCEDIWRPSGYLIPELPNCWRCSMAEVSYCERTNEYTLFNFISNEHIKYKEFKNLVYEMKNLTKAIRNNKVLGSF